MNHRQLSHLQGLMIEDPDDLTDEELTDFISLMEQLLREMRHRQLEPRAANLLRSYSFM